jgi:NAD+ synthase
MTVLSCYSFIAQAIRIKCDAFYPFTVPFKEDIEMENNNVLQLMPDEQDRIMRFIRQYANDGEPICILVSGGLDSDVTAHLCVKALGRERIRLVVVLQDEMEAPHKMNARHLAEDLRVPMDEIDLCGFNTQLIKAAEKGNPSLFHSDSLLDPNRAKCSLRTFLISCYQDKGFLIAGTSNRTEVELGFFLPFGDNMAHFKPIAHLYKTQVFQLAQELGCSAKVLFQAPSAGFWAGQEDLTDLAYWIINRAPIMGTGRVFTDEDDKQMETIRATLTQKAVDLALYGIYHNLDLTDIIKMSGLSEYCVSALISITESSKKWKTRPLLQHLEIR